MSQIIIDHIAEAQKLIPTPTEASKLFHEHNFILHKWHIQTANGYSSTMPLFYFYFEKEPYQETPAEH